jgi:UDP-2-acetamido-2-deoxy-ribo-hexuluronate aminotransferase
MSNLKFPINMYDPTRDYAEHKEEYDEAIHNVLNKGNFIGGEQVTEFEKQLSCYTGAKHCITCANGTDALYIALLALDIGIGDEVITVAHTWISTSEVISLAHAIPVFVDIENITFNIDVSKIEEKITHKTKAILPVSLYGHMPDYAKIKEIGIKYGIPVIEDGAQSFGAIQNGQKSCSCFNTDIATTSFFPSKPMGCYGDGGALFTNDDVLAKKIRAIKSHGGLERFKHKYIGLNSRLDTIQAAILLVKLKYIDEKISARNDVASYYTSQLQNISRITLPTVHNNNTHALAQYSVLTSSKAERDALFNKLKADGVNCAIFYPSPLHTQECFAYLGYKYGDLPITETVCDTIINFPMYAELTRLEQDHVINIVKEFYL